MGNTESSEKKHHSNHTYSKKSSKKIAPEIDTFFKWFIENRTESNSRTLDSYFSNSSLIKIILLNENQKLDLENVKFIMSEMLELFTPSSIFDFYIDAIFKSTETINYQNVIEIFENCLHFTLKSIGFYQVELSNHSKITIQSIISSINFSETNGQKCINKFEFKDWIVNEFPQLFYGFHSWFLKRIKELSFEDDLAANKNKQEEEAFRLAEDLSMYMNKTIVWYLICNLPLVYVKNLASENGSLIERLKNCLFNKSWKKLYVSEDHGLSLNRFQSCLFNYKAPTIMFIFCNSGNLYCICSSDEYKESPTGYGDDQVRIFKFWKNFKVFETSSSKNIYLNTKSRGLKLGLIFGYSQTKPILKIDENLHSIEHESVPDDYIISVEVWGCGNNKAFQDQNNIKKWETKQIEKMRTVKIDAEWATNGDKALLDLAGIKTEHSERGDM